MIPLINIDDYVIGTRLYGNIATASFSHLLAHRRLYQAGAHEDCLVDEVDTETACLTCGSFSFGENWVGCSARVMVEWAFPSRRWGVDEGLTVFGSNEDARLEVDDGFSGFDCFGREVCRALQIPICIDSRILL